MDESRKMVVDDSYVEKRTGFDYICCLLQHNDIEDCWLSVWWWNRVRARVLTCAAFVMASRSYLHKPLTRLSLMYTVLIKYIYSSKQRAWTGYRISGATNGAK